MAKHGIDTVGAYHKMNNDLEYTYFAWRLMTLPMRWGITISLPSL